MKNDIISKSLSVDLRQKYIGKLNMENKVRYKLHKVKKQWVTLAVASVATIGASVTTSSLVSAEINILMDLQQLRSGKYKSLLVEE